MKTLTPFQAKNRANLRSVLGKVAEREFNIRMWDEKDFEKGSAEERMAQYLGRTSECGTAACAFGHYARVHTFTKQDTLRKDQNDPIRVVYSMTKVGEHFGMSKDEAMALFVDPASDHPHMTVCEFLKTLDEFEAKEAAGGE